IPVIMCCFAYSFSRSNNVSKIVHYPFFNSYTHDIAKADEKAIETHEEIEELTVSRARIWWVRFVWLMTWWIPGFMLNYIGKMKRPDVRMAWREKFTLCVLIFLLSAVIIFYI